MKLSLPSGRHPATFHTHHGPRTLEEAAIPDDLGFLALNRFPYLDDAVEDGVERRRTQWPVEPCLHARFQFGGRTSNDEGDPPEQCTDREGDQEYCANERAGKEERPDEKVLHTC